MKEIFCFLRRLALGGIVTAGLVLASAVFAQTASDISPELQTLAERLNCHSKDECAKVFNKNFEQGVVMAEELDVYNPEQKKLAQSFKEEVLSKLAGVSDEEFEERIVELAEKIVNRPTIARQLKLDRPTVTAAKTVVTEVKNSGTSLDVCSRPPSSLMPDQLKLCLEAVNRLAEQKKVVKVYVSEERFEKAKAGDANLQLEEALRQGEYQCGDNTPGGDNTPESCGTFCLNPAEGTAEIPEVCQRIAERFFGSAGVGALKDAYNNVQRTKDFYRQSADKFVLVAPDGRRTTGTELIKKECDSAFSSRNLPLAEACGYFAVRNGFATLDEVEGGLQFLRSYTGTASFNECVINPKSCAQFVSDEHRDKMAASEEIEAVLTRAIGFDSRSCSDPTKAESCFDGAQKALPEMEALASRGSTGVRQMVESFRENLSRGEAVAKSVKEERGPGGCRGIAECLKYCADPEHGPECLAFGGSKGVFSGKEVTERFAIYQKRLSGQPVPFVGEGPYVGFQPPAGQYQPPGQIPGFTQFGPGFAGPPGFSQPAVGPECLSAIQSGDFVKAKELCAGATCPNVFPAPCPDPLNQYRPFSKDQRGCAVPAAECVSIVRDTTQPPVPPADCNARYRDEASCRNSPNCYWVSGGEPNVGGYCRFKNCPVYGAPLPPCREGQPPRGPDGCDVCTPTRPTVDGRQPGPLPGVSRENCPSQKGYVWDERYGCYYPPTSCPAVVQITCPTGSYPDYSNVKPWECPRVGSCVPGNQPCPALPTVESCPAGQKKTVSYSSPECGTFYKCETSTSCPSGQYWDGGTCVTSGGGGGGTMRRCFYPNASINGRYPGYTVWCVEDYVDCHEGDPSGKSVSSTGLSLGAPSTCESGWTGGGGQRQQVWNSFGLQSQVRTDTDPARIETLKQACANVPPSSYVWMPRAGDFSSVDFGMPDPAQCRSAAACPAGQYWNGTACGSGGTNYGCADKTTYNACTAVSGCTWDSSANSCRSSGSGGGCGNYFTDATCRADTTCEWYQPGSGSAYCRLSTTYTDCVSKYGAGWHTMSGDSATCYNTDMTQYRTANGTLYSCSTTPASDCSGYSGSCSSVVTQSSCNTTSGCYWSNNACSPTSGGGSCSTYSQSNCPATTCTWVSNIPGCRPPGQFENEIPGGCTNGRDDDGDGLIDSADPGCTSSGAYCGDQICNGTETATSCSTDCGAGGCGSYTTQTTCNNQSGCSWSNNACSPTGGGGGSCQCPTGSHSMAGGGSSVPTFCMSDSNSTLCGTCGSSSTSGFTTSQCQTGGGGAPSPAPTNLTFNLGSSVTSFTWTDNSTNETSYKLWERVSPGGTYAEVLSSGSVSGGQGMMSLSNRSSGTTYEYYIIACNSSGCSGTSNTVFVTYTGGGGGPQCSDDLDNDGDGFKDYPADTGCSSSSDTTETPEGGYCGNNICDSGETSSSCPTDCGGGACYGRTQSACASPCVWYSTHTDPAPHCDDTAHGGGGGGGGGSTCNYNGTCDSWESSATCASDCGSGGGGGSCTAPANCTTSSACASAGFNWCNGYCQNSPCGPVCGNSAVESGESCDNGGANGTCPATCSPSCTTNTCTICGDGSCNGSESSATCPSDCGAPPPYCGDGSCNGGETAESCASDCGGGGGGGASRNANSFLARILGLLRNLFSARGR